MHIDIIITFLITIIVMLIIYMFFIEPVRLKKTELNVHENSHYLKILQFSDLHIRTLRISIKKINRTIQNAAPDIIVITGDLINNIDDLSKLDNFFSSLLFRKDIFLVKGNHDCKALKSKKDLLAFNKMLNKYPNIKLLVNENYIIKRKNKTLSLICLDDYKLGEYDFDIANNLLKKASGYKVIVTHNPDASLDFKEGDYDLMISGHLHGGQIYLPFNFEFIALRHDKLPKMGFKKGLCKINGNSVYLNRGLGTTFIPARFLSLPEATLYII